MTPPYLFLFTSVINIVLAVELVAYATDHQHRNIKLLQNTARWHGWSPLHVIGTQDGFNNHGLVDKLRALRRFTREWPDDTILAFVDGYDVIVNNEPSNLESAFLSSGKRVLIASELGCCVDKGTAMSYGTTCHRNWPFAHVTDGRQWINSGVIIGYASDIRRLLRLAWKEYKTDPSMYRAYTDQQLLCFLLSDGSSIWTRATIGIDHDSAVALTTYQTDISPGGVIGFDTYKRVVFLNRTIPSFIHFNGPMHEKKAKMEYAEIHFPIFGLDQLAWRESRLPESIFQ